MPFSLSQKIIDEARAQDWLDLKTKAVFLEVTVYNPNANLFASVTAVKEFLTTGAAVERVEVKVGCTLHAVCLQADCSQE